MAFKLGATSSISLDSPERMFLDFSDRAFKGLLTHQGHVLAEYQAKALSTSNVAIKLPTGSGKTLVGILIAEWRRRQMQERVVYVCPTRQLVHQVVEEARTKYGMRDAVAAFVGRKADYNPADKGRFQSGDVIAVTTYGGLFNARTFFDEPHCLIFDDAHAAENYMAQHWTLQINRISHSALFSVLASILGSVVSPLDAKRLRDDAQSAWDISWVDMIPTELVASIEPQLLAALDEHLEDDDLRWRWREIRDHLGACRLYISTGEIMFRPLIPPTLRYAPFAGAKQRIFMSATLGEGGDLERVTGVPRIQRLSVSDDFNAQGVGRRFFILPGRALADDEQHALQCAAIQEAQKAVVLVPDFKTARIVEEEVASTIQYPVYSASQIEESKQAFVQEPQGVAVLANRYDGIDFPDEQCRLLIMRGLPAAANLQERFLVSRMSAGLLLADRVRTRVVQAVGRCTRSATDYSAVILLGEDLHTYISKRETRSALHPELQAELTFGIEQSGTSEEMLDNLRLFYARGEEWRSAENEIRRLRGLATQTSLPALEQLREAADHEVSYQYAMWDRNPASALEQARHVLTLLQDGGLKGYRALWNYLAGDAASQSTRAGAGDLSGVAREYYTIAAKASSGIAWLRQLAGLREAQLVEDSKPGISAAPLIERLELRFADLGTRHDEKFAKVERLILQGIGQDAFAPFENAQMEFGLLLGFDAGNEETEGAPDPWWVADESFAIVFEDFTEAQPNTLLPVNKARQVASHPTWLRQRLGLGDQAKVVPVLVSEILGAAPAAAVHLQDVAFWRTSEFRVWATNALRTIRSLRTTYPGPGDMFWREEAMAAYAANGMDPASLSQRLQPLRGAATF
ncbi:MULTISPECIES: DEAD/DEAH box helicase [unclassified Mesorhizobium]|uniref:DEAD/DEAH box helicase n=1 Tax=unclassified Mesorhizobium TaxID=325217 RepID=UPI000FCC10ED|nr:MULTISPECIES: DEAD/DEAH box helicase [unclassified Mesorhizobium]RUU68053.1 DEAD/DEAH box helicase [Mesorhizobium sp. M7A.T.Ca.TU.009.01.1.1]RUU84158.1 DEAD/DEAH box helicase [Mesorhizobium sp. M7A.T.Ca.TU.009.01.1.2]RUT84546.1 DEAD/DEAH box helicase [Mesorhizobium sp. M7A.T.Ca.US.000.02.1.1]RUT91729.1 DEAD/DEAH box helicase [Mesorhizobium sp. M7A.T.Ca.US.000.02.2.1]RUU05891.1 DEAD/DEAH box helicase [Mesorhizobium sp. M7A.T.Ca.TU.009.02.1.1]